jgi:cytochrome c-type biogenesis protein CcmH
MATFLVLAALMIATALAFVLVPLLRHARNPATADDVRRLRALDEALASGVVDADEYARKRAALAQDAPARNPGVVVPRSRAAFVTLIAVALVLPASALLLYRLIGAPEALDPAKLAPPPEAHTAADMDKAIAGLAEKLKQQPGDAQGWALLGRAYAATNRAGESLDAFRHAHENAPDDADITLEYAQALAIAAPDHLLAGEPRTLLEGVLAKDPKNQRALWLIGISDYQNEDYAKAIERWKILLPMLQPDSEVARSVRNEIADAEAHRDGRAPPEPEAAPDAASSTTSDAAAAATTSTDKPSSSAPRLTVQVALDPELAGKLDPDATLFVFARAASGPPMPLAIQRLKASQLPATVTLDDSMSMMPSMSLSKFAEVVVGARISKSGNAMPQSGDLETLSPPVASNRSEPIALRIDQIVP